MKQLPGTSNRAPPPPRWDSLARWRPPTPTLADTPPAVRHALLTGLTSWIYAAGSWGNTHGSYFISSARTTLMFGGCSTEREIYPPGCGSHRQGRDVSRSRWHLASSIMPGGRERWGLYIALNLRRVIPPAPPTVFPSADHGSRHPQYRRQCGRPPATQCLATYLTSITLADWRHAPMAAYDGCVGPANLDNG